MVRQEFIRSSREGAMSKSRDTKKDVKKKPGKTTKEKKKEKQEKKKGQIKMPGGIE
jgi:hypothetical protein